MGARMWLAGVRNFLGPGQIGFHGYMNTKLAGQTLRGLKFSIYLFIFLRSVPKTQSAHEWDLELVSGAEIWSELRYF